MPSRNSQAPLAPLPTIPKELVVQFVRGPMTAETVNAASLAFKRRLSSARSAPR